MNLNLGTCSLRTLRASDAESIARHLNDRNVSRNLRDAVPFPSGLEHAQQLIERFTAPGNARWWSASTSMEKRSARWA